LRDALADTPVVLVNGPRQSGRITLLRQFATDQPRLVGPAWSAWSIAMV